jgi:hypothetical protein
MPRPAFGLDHDFVARDNQLGDRGRGEADAIFMNLDFLGHADAHDLTS